VAESELGVSETTFYHWKKKVNRAKGERRIVRSDSEQPYRLLGWVDRKLPLVQR
jgi:hypothetical protein